MQASEETLRSAVARLLEPAGEQEKTRDGQQLELGTMKNKKVTYHMNNTGTIDTTVSNTLFETFSGVRGMTSDAEPPLLAHRVNIAGDSQQQNQIKVKRGKVNRPGDNTLKTRLKRQLLKMDFSHIIAHAVSEMLVTEQADPKTLLPQALALISNQMPIYKEDVTAVGGTVALLGATGVGKTTTIAKLATRYALRHGKDNVALVTTDNKRIAAAEQLRVYSNLLGIQYKVAADDIELLDALNEFSDKPFVLIDTAGMGPKEICNSKFYDLFAGGITQIKNFLVMSSTMNRAALEQSTQEFSRLKLDGCIITKIDETTSLGAPISSAILFDLPVAYFSDGQQIPDDFHLARAHVLMSRAVRVVNQFDELKDFSVSNKVGLEANVSL